MGRDTALPGNCQGDAEQKRLTLSLKLLRVQFPSAVSLEMQDDRRMEFPAFLPDLIFCYISTSGSPNP